MVVKEEKINWENVVLSAEFNVRMVGEIQRLLPHVSCKVLDCLRFSASENISSTLNSFFQS